MAKTRKRKNAKDLDFQKVKLKVGRRLKRNDNETKAEFKTRKIVLKEVKSYSQDPFTALVRHSDHISHHGKLTMLNHFNSALKPEVAKSLNKPILDGLSKFILDHSQSVRQATIKCLKTCYNSLRRSNQPTTDFIQSLRPYLECAYTHVSAAIVDDCYKFIDYFVKINDPSLFQPLMCVILKRHASGAMTTNEHEMAAKLRHYYLRHRAKKQLEILVESDKIRPLFWSESNFVLDLDSHMHKFSASRFYNPEREVHLCLASSEDQLEENIVEEYLARIAATA